MTFIKNTYKLFSNNIFQTILLSIIVMSILNEYTAFNITESEPTGIYILSRAKVIKRNDIVLISNNINSITRLSQERHYTNAHRLMKTVMGIPGDNVTILNDMIYINDEIIGKIHTVDSQNRPLPSIIRAGTIPDQYYFLASRRHENSFDSRYFGLVSKECIQKKASPLLTKE